MEINKTFEELQLEESVRLNNAIKTNTIQPNDEEVLKRKVFNPQTGELQLWVDNGKGGVRWASVNLFE